MKIFSKILITLVSIVLGAVGCQRLEMVSEQPGEHVKFSPYIGKSGTLTKGTPLTAFAVGDRFKVFAFDENTGDVFFNDQTVSLYENGAWMYTPLKMWNKNSLDFYAYSPVGNSNVSADITFADQTFELTVPANVDQHVDLVVAGNLGLNNVDVPLTFKHITSRVSFKALKEVGDPNKEKVRITSLQIDDETTPANGLIARGKYTVEDVAAPTIGKWDMGAATAVYEPELTHAASIDLQTTAQYITKENQSMFLIPQQLTNKRLIVEYEFSLDGGFSWTKCIANIKLYGTNSQGDPILPAGFEQGKHYVFTLNLKAARTYTFTPTIEPWDSEDVAFTPASPLSVERIETVGTSSIERFVITDESKLGYTIASQAIPWMRVGRSGNLSFTDANVKGSFTYTDGMTKATGDTGDPAQDWYIYLAPNPGGERRSSIKITFSDPAKPAAFIQVIQAAGSIADNPIKLSYKAVRIYTTLNTALTDIELGMMKSEDAALTQGVQIVAPLKSTLAAPVLPVDLSSTETPLKLNLAFDFVVGAVSIQAKDYAMNMAVSWAKNIGLSNVASNRAVQGKFVKAEIADPASTPWCKVTLDGVNYTNANTTVTSNSPAAIYLVVEENPTPDRRVVAVKLTDESGYVTLDYYYQDPSTLINPQLTADVGQIYFYGSHASKMVLAKITSQAARTYTVGSVGSFGISVGNGSWASTAGAVRTVGIDMFSVKAQDSYITLTSTGATPFSIPVKLGKALPAGGGKIFIPGEYESATPETAGAATISNSDSDPGESSLATVTNPNGVWIHYGQNYGIPRSTLILLRNSSDWRKTTRVYVCQDALLINHNEDFTDIAHPVKWAGSNIYVNEAGELTFDDVNVTTHAKYQGVFFRWGGLTALQPTASQLVPGNGIVWKPEEYTGTTMTHLPIVYGTPYPAFAPHVQYNPAAGQGDICRYMTEKKLAPGGKKWRLPTSMEFSRTAQNGLIPVNPYNQANPTPSIASDAVNGKPGAKDLGRGIIESGIIMAGTFFPAGGLKNLDLNWFGQTFINASYWSSCYTTAYVINASLLSVDVDKLNPSVDLGDLPYTAGWQVLRSSPIRCVIDEDNTY